jgi:hypothetical protein
MRSNLSLNTHSSIADLKPRELHELEKEIDALWLSTKGYGVSKDQLSGSLQKNPLQKKKSWFPTVAAVLGPLGLLGTAGGWAILRHSEKNAAKAAKQSKKDKRSNYLLRQLFGEAKSSGKPLVDIEEPEKEPGILKIRTLHPPKGKRGDITSSVMKVPATDGLIDALDDIFIIHQDNGFVERPKNWQL